MTSKPEAPKKAEANDTEPVAADDSNVTKLPEFPEFDEAAPAATPEELDEEEAEFRALRRDLPGVKGASAAGIVTISVGKTPAKNEFFRTHRDFRPIVPHRRHRGRNGEAVLRRQRRTWSSRWPASASPSPTTRCI